MSDEPEEAFSEEEPLSFLPEELSEPLPESLPESLLVSPVETAPARLSVR